MKFFKSLKPIEIKNSLLLRKFSTITYATHASIIFVLKKMASSNSIFNFFVTIIICSAITFIINYLSNKKYFKWLKYAY